jgi:hypothetical protein
VKCGDKGFLTADGQPCGQPIAASAKGCVWHSRTPEERSALATKGALASRMRRYLPTAAPAPEFSTTEAIVRWAEQTAHRVLTGTLDPRAASEARQLAALTVSARQAEAQASLVDALMRLESGGAAVALLAQFTNANGKRTPLPPRPWASLPTSRSADISLDEEQVNALPQSQRDS